MSSEMVLASDDVGAKLVWAKQLAGSNLLPDSYKNNPANILYAVELGDALGIPRITAINQVHVIKGKPSASANLISALVRRAGHRLRVVANDKEATATIVRCDDKDFEFKAKWDLDRAQKAGLMSNDTWKKFPAAMLKARAITEVARMACEEALSGVCYTPEELGADVDAAGNVVDVTPPASGKWSDLDRKVFCAKLGEMGLRYEDVADWCESLDRPRPSNMDPTKRDALLRALQGSKRSEFDAFMALRVGAPESPANPEAEALPVSDPERGSAALPDGKAQCPKCGRIAPRDEVGLADCAACEVK